MPLLLVALVMLSTAIAAGEPSGLVAPRAVAREVGQGYHNAAGSAVAEDGRVFFSDAFTNRIMVWSPETGISTWREDSGGAYGLAMRAGQLYACQSGRRQVASFASDGTITPLAYHGGGKRFANPHHLWVTSEGGVYFTDQSAATPSDQQAPIGSCIWYIAPGSSDAAIVAKDFSEPAGVIGTPDGKTLFVADRRDAAVWKFAIDRPGHLADRMKFCSEGADGICLDMKGDLYLTWKRGVQVYAPDGSKLGTISMAFEPSSLCFAGPARSILFITGGAKVYTLEMRVRGTE
jgi:gluconolactonase